MKQYKSAFSDEEEEEDVDALNVEEETDIKACADNTLTSNASEDGIAVVPERQGRPVSVERYVCNEDVK